MVKSWWSKHYLIPNANCYHGYKDNENLPCNLRHHCYNSEKLDHEEGI